MRTTKLINAKTNLDMEIITLKIWYKAIANAEPGAEISLLINHKHWVTPALTISNRYSRRYVMSMLRAAENEKKHLKKIIKRRSLWKR